MNNSNNQRGNTRRCYNCNSSQHLVASCPKLLHNYGQNCDNRYEDEVYYNCNFCDDGFMDQADLDRHLKWCNDGAQNSEYLYEDISETEESFSENDDCSENESKEDMNGEDYYECNICYDRFKYQREIERHVRRSHLTENESGEDMNGKDYYECNICY